MALKVFENPNNSATRGFKLERDIFQLLRKASLRSEGICMNFATFEHGRTLNIISTWADLDLFGFLIGTYDDYPDRARHFTPWHLFEQTRCLAKALLFLHEELDIDGPITCAHLDLKPENVLVEWQMDSEDDGGAATSSKRPAGLWKINDFGISTVRSRDTHTGSGAGSRLTPGDMLENFLRERSSISAPRDSGAFLPPEMKRHFGKKSEGTSSHVSKESDMWSLGCILAMVLAFTLDGPEMAAELYACRHEGYEDDYFYFDQPPRIKPEVETWFEVQLVSSKYVTQRLWISECQKLFQCLTEIERGKRPSAKNASDDLQKIRNLAGATLPWSNMPNRPYPSQGERRYPQSTPSRSAAGYNVPIQPSFPPTSSNDNVLEPQITGLRHLSLSTTRTRQGSESWISDSIRLEVPTKMVQASLSPDGRRVCLVGQILAYMYDLGQSMWNTRPAEGERMSRKDARGAFRELPAPAGREWTSALLAGSFVVLMSASIRGTGNDVSGFLY
jgi:serine/threonine protein kinase